MKFKRLEAEEESTNEILKDIEVVEEESIENLRATGERELTRKREELLQKEMELLRIENNLLRREKELTEARRLLLLK